MTVTIDVRIVTTSCWGSATRFQSVIEIQTCVSQAHLTAKVAAYNDRFLSLWRERLVSSNPRATITAGKMQRSYRSRQTMHIAPAKKVFLGLSLAPLTLKKSPSIKPSLKHLYPTGLPHIKNAIHSKYSPAWTWYEWSRSRHSNQHWDLKCLQLPDVRKPVIFETKVLKHTSSNTSANVFCQI